MSRFPREHLRPHPRGWTEKVGFDTEKEALETAGQMRNRHHDLLVGLVPYLCGVCDRWHLGNRRNGSGPADVLFVELGARAYWNLWAENRPELTARLSSIRSRYRRLTREKVAA